MRIFIFFILLSLNSLFTKGQENCINHWETIIYPDNTWKYVIDSAFQDDSWKLLSFDDSQWNKGKGGIGYDINFY